MKRILTIDGGGIKGVFPASFLSSIEEQLESQVVNYFDLIVGTSTGGIIALALGLGMTSKDILTFYQEEGPTIFGGNRMWRALRHPFSSKYSNKPLETALTKHFGEKLLGDSKTRLVVPTFNLETGEVYIMKTAHHPDFTRDYKNKAVDVALATSAAPTFFPTFRSIQQVPHVDGGIWANNPAGVAAVEAVGILKWDPSDIAMLSIGCTSSPYDGRSAIKRAQGYLHWWLPNIANAFMSAQSSAAIGTAKHLISKERFYRINPSVPHGRFSLDDTNGITSLTGLGFSEARTQLPLLKEIFFESLAEGFQPIHSLTPSH